MSMMVRRTRTLRPPDVRAIRRRLNLSRVEFAQTYNIPLTMLRTWEDGSRKIEATSRAYLRLITRQPKLVREALNK